MTPTGCIHGRFQIFHNDHLAYLLEAFQKCERLIIGLTSVNGLRGENPSTHRNSLEDNPFTYFERIEMIRSVIEVHPLLDLSRISFSPFPIESPELLSEFIPTTIPCFTTVREEWNRQKIELLESLGYSVSVLSHDLNKTISGTKIRELVRKHNDSWKTLVPKALVAHLETHKLLNLIKNGPKQ